MRERNTILISGYAKLPANITAESVFNTMVVAVRFDKRNGIILNAEASVVTDLAKNYISELFVGYNLNDGPEELLSCFEAYYYGNTKKAIETAIRMIFQRYHEFQMQNQKSQTVKNSY